MPTDAFPEASVILQHSPLLFSKEFPMTYQFSNIKKHKSAIITTIAFVFALLFLTACAGESVAKTETAKAETTKAEKKNDAPVKPQSISMMEAITQTATPADKETPKGTVVEFYKAIREKRFQEAFLMTNWKPAVEGLTKEEIADLKPDFENLSAMLESEQLLITGEQSSATKASVFIKSVDGETGREKIDEIKLRKENGVWLMLLGDEEAEKAVKNAGKTYFFALRIETNHQQVDEMLERIAKAQIVQSVQNQGNFGDLDALINANLIPEEVKDAKTNGYKYSVTLSGDKKKYTVRAEPTTYGKTGKLSYLMQIEGNANQPVVKKEDNKGKALK